MPRPKDGVKGQPAWWFSRLWVGDTCHHPSQGNLSLQSICKLAEWPLQWRTDMWSQQSRQHVHTHFLIHYLSSPKNRGEKSAHLTGQETARGHCRLNPNLACPRLQEETSYMSCKHYRGQQKTILYTRQTYLVDQIEK